MHHAFRDISVTLMKQSLQLRRIALPGVLLASTAIFAVVIHQHVPFQSWLFFHYLTCWLLVAVFCAACLALGHCLTRPLAPTLPILERVTLAFAAGVLAFATLVFLTGIAHLLSAWSFFALPGAALLLAGPRARRELGPELWAAVVDGWTTPSSGLVRAISVSGIIAVLLVYLPILSPENVAYDSRWYHLAIAEHYAVDGAIRRFPEGLLAASYPQTATMLYTWALSSPFGGLFDRVELAAHLEFALFLATLAGIPSLVARLLPERRGRATWAALFLFPGIFVYDSELSCAADHVAALFAIPIFLALLRAWHAPTPRSCALLAIFVAGALSVKYTAASLAVGPGLALLVRVGWLMLRAKSRRGTAALLASLAVFATVLLLLTAPHWLKNWIFYGDPVYPLLAERFDARPWAPSAGEWQKTFQASQLGIPGTVQVETFGDLLYVLASFSLDVHDFPHFHGKLPVFGSLFTISTLALPFLKGARPLVGPTLATYAGMVLWALLNAQDRYLQALLPWMVVVTAGTLMLAWRAGPFARLGAGLAVAMQALWGANAWLIPSHAMTRKPPLGATIELLGSRTRPTRPSLVPFEPWPSIGKMVGPRARLLLHEGELHLGVGVPTVLDTIPFMYGIDYGSTRSCREVHELLRSMGATHVLWQPASRGADSLAGDIISLTCFRRHTRGMGTFAPFTLAELPTTAPSGVPFGDVVVLACLGFPYGPGVYPLSDLAVPPRARDLPSRYARPRVEWQQLDEPARAAAIAGAEFLVVEQGCAGSSERPGTGWQQVGQRGPAALYAR
jgi:hypothetical protein